MSKTNAKVAFDTLNALREKFSQIDHEVDGKTIKVTFSVGISVYPNFLTTQTLVKSADQALYLAKEQGRNRVVIMK